MWDRDRRLLWRSLGFRRSRQWLYDFQRPFIGLNQVVRPDGFYGSQQRFGMYRWHVPDPIAFESALRVTVQDLGWHRDRRYLKRRDDVASTAFWYHHDPACLPGRHLDIDEMEVGSA